MDEEIILILGAGPAGLASAWELHKAGKSSLLIEKNDKVGGLSRTLQYGDFRTDIGPHRFFSQNPDFYVLIADLLGHHWLKVNRLTRFYIRGKFFSYPLEIKNTLVNIGGRQAFIILFDYLWQRAKKNFLPKNPTSLAEKIILDFGRTLAQFNMLNYSEKIWGMPPSQISSEWASQRIKGLSLGEAIKKAWFKGGERPKTLVDRFYYPDRGTGLIYEKIKEKILNGGKDSIRFNSYPVKIIQDEHKITAVIIKGERGEEIIKPGYVISSIPITEMVSLLEPEAPVEILEASQKLKFRSHLSLFITLTKPLCFFDQWIYFPNKEIPFGRIMAPQNFSPKMCPSSKSSLLLEFFCWENDKIWKMTGEELLELSMPWLEKLEFIKKEDIEASFVHREKDAYPVYKLNYKVYLEKVKGYLGQFKNLQLVGRIGSFRYNNQDHALEMGILAAKSIIEGKPYNLEKVGSAQEYFENKPY